MAFLAIFSANFTRPGDTTAYASGDLVANSTTAGSVVPLSWDIGSLASRGTKVRRARLRKSTTTVTAATFRLHLYGTSPTIANGDNAAWSTTHSTYLGSFDLDASGTAGRAFTNGVVTFGVSSAAQEPVIRPDSGQTVYGLLEARAAYAPGNAEVFTVDLEIEQL